MATISDMAFSHFSDRVGQGFDVDVGADRVSLTLQAAQELPGSPRPGGAFRLEFVGPPEPVLQQSTYGFENGNDRFEIFVVAIGRDMKGMRYEAVFF